MYVSLGAQNLYYVSKDPLCYPSLYSCLYFSIYLFSLYLQGGRQQDIDAYSIKFLEQNEYIDQYTGEAALESIERSTVKAYSLDFELQKLISYCDSNIDSMTQCVLEAYGKMFGSDYNNVVDLKMALSTTAGKGKLSGVPFHRITSK